VSNEFRQRLDDGERAGQRYGIGMPKRIMLGTTGMYQGRHAGSSLEFREHREYQPGDDLRRIDWNAYARSDQITVKLFHEEIDPHVDIVLDASRSMTLVAAKQHAALALAAFFATAATNSAYSHRVWLARDGCDPLAGGSGRAAEWHEFAFNFIGNPDESFARRPPKWRSRSLRVLLSDLLWSRDPMQVLGPCAEQASAVIVLQILARADADPGETGHIRLTDVETNQVRELVIDETGLRRYREALARHQQNWHRACRQTGAFLTTVIAEDLLRDWRLDELVNGEYLKVI